MAISGILNVFSHDKYSKTCLKRSLKKTKIVFQYRLSLNAGQMKKVNKRCLLDTPRTVRVSEKTWQVIVQTSRPRF